MKKGSITIFSLLSMMLVVSALFTLLEASRFQEIKKLAPLQTQVAMESVFAEYNTYLWEEYRILVCNRDTVENKLEQYGNGRVLEESIGTNFFQFCVEQTKLEGYTRLTDGDGNAFIQSAAGYMERNVIYEGAKEIYNQYEGVKSIQNTSKFRLSDIEKGLQKLENTEVSVGSAGHKEEIRLLSENSTSNSRSYQVDQNPLEVIQSMQRKGVLSLVLEDTSQLSNKIFGTADKVSNRQLSKEFYPMIEDVDWYDRIRFQQYVLSYMSTYMDRKGHSLDYEVEYMLSGKDTEIENLKEVVNQLLAVREAANFLYLTSNPAKVEQARLLAVAIAGVSLNVALVEVLKTAVLAAWAFAESILDVRTLLTGGKIALLKSDSTWTLDVDNIATIHEGYPTAKNNSKGLSYKEYLGILLLLQQDKILANRAMDVQEFALREEYKDPSICLDEWLIEVRVSVTYRYNPVFFSIQTVMPFWDYKIITKGGFRY